MSASFAFCVSAVMSVPSGAYVFLASSFHGMKNCRCGIHLLPAFLPGYVHLLPDFLMSKIVHFSSVLVLGWCWVRDTDVPCKVLVCHKGGVVSGSVV